MVHDNKSNKSNKLLLKTIDLGIVWVGPFWLLKPACPCQGLWRGWTWIRQETQVSDVIPGRNYAEKFIHVIPTNKN